MNSRLSVLFLFLALAAHPLLAQPQRDTVITKGVAFMLSQQASDGSFVDMRGDDKNHSVMTALTLMAMVSVGNIPADQTVEGESMRRACRNAARSARRKRGSLFAACCCRSRRAMGPGRAASTRSAAPGESTARAWPSFAFQQSITTFRFFSIDAVGRLKNSAARIWHSMWNAKAHDVARPADMARQRWMPQKAPPGRNRFQPELDIFPCSAFPSASSK